MSVETIINEWKKKIFKPIYWLEGEEEYFINKVVEYAENEILTPAESSFNLSVFYGKETKVYDIMSICQRFPVACDKQVVILKEAQLVRDIEKIEAYVLNPVPSTVLVVAYKGKKLDGRKKLPKIIAQKGELFTTKKIPDYKLPEWVQQLITGKGYKISSKALLLLIEHVGNNLSKFENELDKLILNLTDKKSITEDEIEEYIGISKEYNIFELSNALGEKDMAKALKITQYYESNPKVFRIQMILPVLYEYFNKLYMVAGMLNKSEQEIKRETGIMFFVNDYIRAAKRYQQGGIEKVILLLHNYNLKSIGINATGFHNLSMLKELVAKIMAV